MRFVHHKPIHTELFKGDYIVLLFLCFQPFKPCFQLFSGAFQLFNRKRSPLACLISAIPSVISAI